MRVLSPSRDRPLYRDAVFTHVSRTDSRVDRPVSGVVMGEALTEDLLGQHCKDSKIQSFFFCAWEEKKSTRALIV